MVKAAYSSGKPAIGVGPGNTPAIIDSSADLKLAASSIIHSKSFDNGMICASEQSVIVLKDVYDEFKKTLEEYGGYIIPRKDLDKVRHTIVINGTLNSNIVGQKATTIAKMAGLENVPSDRKVLIGEVKETDFKEEFAHEKLSPVLAMYKAENFEEAVNMAEHLIEQGGLGHTSSIYLHEQTEQAKIDYFANKMKTCRILVNTPYIILN